METECKLYEDRYIDIKGVNTRYWEAGSGNETLILVHGFNATVEERKNPELIIRIRSFQIFSTISVLRRI